MTTTKGLTSALIEEALKRPDTKWNMGTILDAAEALRKLLKDIETAAVPVTLIQGGDGPAWACLDEASELVIEDLAPGQYFLLRHPLAP